jgi:chromosomal replication initiation ATPase DnaA
LIYGEPGVGKSYLLNYLADMQKKSVICVNADFIVKGSVRIYWRDFNIMKGTLLYKYNCSFDEYVKLILENASNKIFCIDEIDKFPFHEDKNILRRLLLLIGQVKQAGGIVIGLSNKSPKDFPSELIRTGRLSAGIHAKMTIDDYRTIFKDIFDTEYRKKFFESRNNVNEESLYNILDLLAQKQYENDVQSINNSHQGEYDKSDDLHSISSIITVLDIISGAHKNIREYIEKEA